MAAEAERPPRSQEERRNELWAMADLVTPMAVRVAATLRVADHIATGRRTALELAELVGADADALERLLRHLAGADLLVRDDQGRYELTELGEALRSDHPTGLRAWLDAEGAVGRADLCLVELAHTVRRGEPAYPAHFGGATFWGDLAANHALSASFDALMGSRQAPLAIVSAYDWGSLGHLVDVGGGNGTLMIALLTEYPALRGTVVDLPGPAERARKALAAAGFGDRADAVAGSFFEPLPAGAEGYLLSSIIHDWDDASARRILRRCAEAAGPDGAVFVAEHIGADGTVASTEMDLRMLAYCNGRERGLGELAALAEESGLRMVDVHASGDVSVLELAALEGEP